MTQRISGVLTETQPTNTEDVLLKEEAEAVLLKEEGETVMTVEKGDILRIRGEYVQVDGFFKNQRGNLCMRLGIPKDRASFRRWAHNNPHHIKQLTIGGILIGG